MADNKKVQVGVCLAWNAIVPEIQISSEPMDYQEAAKVVAQLQEAEAKLWQITQRKYVLVQA